MSRESAGQQQYDFEALARISMSLGFQYLETMNDALLHDTKRCGAEAVKAKRSSGEGPLGQEDYRELGFWYRNLARSFISYVEGLLYVMRRLVIFAEERGEIQLPAGESTLMRETLYVFDAKRKMVRERENHNRLLENVVLTLRWIPKVFRSTFEVDYSQNGWEKFQTLVGMRNALTHPKGVEDTVLSPALPNTIRDASTWFYSVMKDFFASIDSAVLEEDQRRTAQLPEVQRLLRERSRSRSVEQGASSDPLDAGR